jgi:hypothetical protein
MMNVPFSVLGQEITPRGASAAPMIVAVRAGGAIRLRCVARTPGQILIFGQ